MRRTYFDASKARDLILRTTMEALHEGGEAILTESLKEVPHATGALQRSATITDSLSERAVYISFNTPYAPRQHEDLTLRHPDPRNPISTPGRKAKFLEDPFNRLKEKVMKLARLRVKKALRGAK